MHRLATCSALLPLLVAAGALAQGPAYNRSLRASDLAVQPSPSGAGWQVSGELHIDGDGSVGGDLSCVVRAFAGGVPVGAPVEIPVSMAGGGSAGCEPVCFTCRMNGGVCFDFRYLCICFGTRNDGSPSSARFAIDVPDLHDGEVVTLQLDAARGSLPELVLADDQASIVVGGRPCRGDFNSDGTLNSQDFFAFLTAFFQGSPIADFNADGFINSQDFFDFLGAFFAGC